MKHKGIHAACLILLFAASLQAQIRVPIPDPLPPIDFAVSPTPAASTDRLELQLSGQWPHECVPEGANVVVSGNTIEVRMLLPGAVTCVEPTVCRPILSFYELNVGVGPLATGTYQVFVRVVTCTQASNTRLIGSFTVGIPSGEPNEPNEPGPVEPNEIGPGTCVVLLQDIPDGNDVLRAGQAGRIVCCDTNDCNDGMLLISWFFRNAAADTTADCFDPNTPRTFPPGSTTWVDPDRVPLGICFDQCGVLQKGDMDCVLLETDDGRTFNLLDGEWLPRVIGPDGVFDFGDRVRVRGLRSIMRPAGVVFTCEEQHGDIYQPVLTPCAPSGGGNGSGGGPCCDGTLRPGDRVRLLVNNPPDLNGTPAMGLPAGTLGTVLCCNAANPQFRIYVSWDNFRGGTDQSSFCATTPISHPAGSAWWVNCADVVALSGGGNGNGNGQTCPQDNLIIGFGNTGVRLFRDPTCPATPRTFTGCANVTVQTNFRARLSLKITPMAGINGAWTGTVTPNVVSAGASNVLVCITASGVNLAGIPAGQNVQVATVAILAVPE